MGTKKIDIVETRHYLSELATLTHKGANEKFLRKSIIEFICFNYQTGDIIPGTSGMRKIRYAIPGKGKRGGFRIIYYFYNDKNPLYLLTVYAKSQNENLTKNELQILSEATKQLKNNMRKTR